MQVPRDKASTIVESMQCLIRENSVSVSLILSLAKDWLTKFLAFTTLLCFTNNFFLRYLMLLKGMNGNVSEIVVLCISSIECVHVFHCAMLLLLDFSNSFLHATFVCGWLQIGMSGWFTHYSLRCQPVDYSDNPSAIRVSGLHLLCCLTSIHNEGQQLRCLSLNRWVLLVDDRKGFLKSQAGTAVSWQCYIQVNNECMLTYLLRNQDLEAKGGYDMLIQFYILIYKL